MTDFKVKNFQEDSISSIPTPQKSTNSAAHVLDQAILAATDQFSQALKVISSEHARIHAGQAFTHGSLHLALANATSYYHLLDNPAGNYPHIRLAKVTCEGAPFWLELFEGATTSGGTAADVFNNNRNSLIASKLLMYHAPTVSAEGTALPATMITGSGSAGGSSEFSEIEWILKPATKYLIKVTNKSGAARDWSLDTFHYEL